MRVPFYDIKAQYDELATEIDAAVHEVVSGGAYMLGPNHNAFEREMADLHGVRHGIALNSGTDALRIMMDAAGIGPGDEVLTTAFTFVASTETIVQVGATPVFVDIDPATFMMDPALLAEKVTERTKAILPVHLFGQMAPMAPIMDLAKRHDLVVLEDAAQAVGASQNGTPAGGFGLSAGLSFYVTKNLGAMGDAGMILTDDDEQAELCRSIRVHGMGRQRYYYDHVGYTSRMDEVQAAFLRVKLRRLADWTARRARVAAIYSESLARVEGLTLPTILPGNETTWHQYAVLTPHRDALMAHLKEAGVDSMIYYPVPLHYHAPYAPFGAGEGSLPETERVCREILCLPIHSHLSDAAARHVAESVKGLVA